MIFETVFDKFGNNWKEFWDNLDYIAFWGWIIFSIGVIFLFLLIFFTEYKRAERDSIKFTTIMIILASAFMGFGLNMVLVSQGIW